jgi:hypothetical protein
MNYVLGAYLVGAIIFLLILFASCLPLADRLDTWSAAPGIALTKLRFRIREKLKSRANGNQDRTE